VRGWQAREKCQGFGDESAVVVAGAGVEAAEGEVVARDCWGVAFADWGRDASECWVRGQVCRAISSAT
jgi:hypothetical protein